MNKKIYFFSFVILIMTVFVSCKEDPTPEPPKDTPRTILVYMIASNSLGSYGYDTSDIKEMTQAVKSGNINNCRILVYHVTYGGYPKLFELKRNSGGEVSQVVHKIYENNEKSTTSARMTEVFNDMKKYAPAKDYGLVLWSHSSGWAETLPTDMPRSYQGYSDGEFYLTRQFGDDKGSQMPIDVLVNTVPARLFSFVYCDVCYMGSIEIAYQFREKTRYFVGSAALLPADGMPYDKNIPIFCQDNIDMAQACDNTYQYYNSKTGIAKTITIALVDCSKIEELALVCKDIYSSSNEVQDISGIQKYISPNDGVCIYFDFAQYTKMRASNAQQIDALNTQLKNVILYKASTQNIFGKLPIDLNNFCGVSSYIMATGGANNDKYYKTLDWYKNVYSE